jgi:hypothetical protein
MEVPERSVLPGGNNVVPPGPRVSHALLMGFIGSVSFVFIVGVAFAVGFNTKHEYDILASDITSADDAAVEIDVTEITLSTLTGNLQSSIDIQRCFERAMRARHVQFRDSLVIINPSEITLSTIIGGIVNDFSVYFFCNFF